MSTAASLTRVRPITRAVRLTVARERLAVAGLIVASAVARIAAAVPHSTPRLFPDEYIYAALGRSIANGRTTIRGTPSHFPALLEPILTAPFWALGTVDQAFRATQVMHAIVASLAAVPVWLLARRLGLEAWQRLACVVLTLVLPALLYVSYLTADIVAFTLALAAVYAAVVALAAPTRRSQSAFLVLAGLSTFARVQYVVLPIAFSAAMLVMSRGRPRVAAQRYRFTLAALVVLTLAIAAAGLGRVLGYYHTVFSLNVHVASIVSWAGTDLMLFAYASGFVLVPSALVGLALGITGARDDSERAFAAFAAAFSALVLTEASVYAANGTDRFQERYLMALLPLVPLLFFLGVRRTTSTTARNATMVLALALLVLSARVPLSGYVVRFGSLDSPLLQAVSQLELRTSVGTGSLLVALGAGTLSLLAAAAVVRPKRGAVAAAAAAAIVLAVAAGAAVATDVQKTRSTLGLFPADARWIDHTGLRNVSMLVLPGHLRAAGSARMFWNTSITRILEMGGTDPVDAFGSTPVQISSSGLILAAGRPVTTPIVVGEYGSDIELTGARLVRRVVGASLWVPTGAPRLTMMTYGRYLDGWLAWPQATITIWPRAAAPRRGVLCLDLSAPVEARQSLRLSGPGVRRAVVLPAGGSRTVSVPVVARRPWTLVISAAAPLSAASRPVSALAARPSFIPGKASPSACR